MARLPEWHRATWPEYLLGLALVAAPLAFGSVHVDAQIALAAVLLGAFWLQAWRLAREGQRVRVGWIGLALVLALGWSFLMWLPLPAGLVEVLSPSGFEARRAAFRLAGLEAPGWMPLALDAGRTAAGIVSLGAVTS